MKNTKTPEQDQDHQNEAEAEAENCSESFDSGSFDLTEDLDSTESLETNRDLPSTEDGDSNEDSPPTDAFDSDEDLEASPISSDTEDLDFVSESSETIEEQLSRLSKAISQQFEEDSEISDLIQPTDRAEEILAEQIEEELSLVAEEKAMAENEAAASASDSEEPSLSEKSLLDISEIQSCIEALLFISDKPIAEKKLREMLHPDLDPKLFQQAVEELRQRYQSFYHGIELVEVAGGFQLRTKPGRADLAKKLVKVQSQRLSTGAMETLAIIAYQEPVMKEEIDKIRGVDSSYFIRTLIDRKLIQISGRSELPGRPILYSTTTEFLEVFGLKDLRSLPPLRELEQMVPHSQSENPDDQDPRVRQMRRLVGEMKTDQSTLYYNPKEDDRILKEIRERVLAIPSSTPYLDDLKAAEALAAQPAVATAEPEGASPSS